MVGKVFDLDGEALCACRHEASGLQGSGLECKSGIELRNPNIFYLTAVGIFFDLHGEALGSCRTKAAGLEGPGLEC